jgi:plastocyanin
LFRFALASALLLTVLSAHPTAAATTLTVSAGAESADREVQLNAFAPAVTSINVGDTVTWRLDSTEFHTVTFLAGQPEPEFVEGGPEGPLLNPAAAFPAGGTSYDGTTYTNSGLLMLSGPNRPTYSLTFPRAGSYDYICIVHPGMQGRIVVNPAGQQADTQATVDARRKDEVNSLLATQAISVIMTNAGELPAEGVTAGLAMGAGGGLVDVQRFFPPRVTIHAGDSLTWINRSFAPHTVTFLAGGEPPAVIVPQPQPNGPPRLLLNPEMFLPAGDATDYDGSGYLNSGFKEPGPQGTFTVTFSQPGTYPYLCLLHDGMTGVVIVQPSSSE